MPLLRICWCDLSLTFSCFFFFKVLISLSFLKDRFSGYTVLGCQSFKHLGDIFYCLYFVVLHLITVVDLADKEVMYDLPIPLTYTHRHTPDLDVLCQGDQDNNHVNPTKWYFEIRLQT